MTTQIVRHLADYGQTRHQLEALHWHGFTVTIHSPRTSHNGLYCVTAYGSEGKRPETFKGARAHLDEAIRDAAMQLGGRRLKAFATYTVDVSLSRLDEHAGVPA